MYKKSITACMAVAALAAFALPASASAADTSPVLTTATPGETAAVGTKVTATSIGSTFFKGSFGEVKCEHATLHGTITKNSGKGEAIEGTIETAEFWGGGTLTTGQTKADCTSTLGNVQVTTNVGNGTPWCEKALPGAAMELQVRGGACNEKARSITYVLDFSGMTCSYERTATTGPVKGTYNTSPEDAKGTIPPGAGSEFKGEAGNNFFCPGSGSLEMEFELETSTGGTLTIS